MHKPSVLKKWDWHFILFVGKHSSLWYRRALFDFSQRLTSTGQTWFLPEIDLNFVASFYNFFHLFVSFTAGKKGCWGRPFQLHFFWNWREHCKLFFKVVDWESSVWHLVCNCFAIYGNCCQFSSFQLLQYRWFIHSSFMRQCHEGRESVFRRGESFGVFRLPKKFLKEVKRSVFCIIQYCKTNGKP